MTERLYYNDSYGREFTARVVERSADGRTVYLDRTLFYPASGGQPFDVGSIAGVAVIEVVDEEERIAHRLAAPLEAEGEVAGEIDWARRFDHMQQHSGQHLLSAVFEELYGLHTVSFHLGAESATIDLEGGGVEARMVTEAERRANQVVAENRALDVRFEGAGAAQGLRKASEREGLLRIVSIDGLDRSACGGTHVRTTGEIGPILLRRTEKIRQAVRVEFVCGGRAVRRARADFEALSRIAQLFSAPLDEVAGMVAAQLEAAKAGERARRKLELELAAYRGKELYAMTEPGPDGMRRAVERLNGGNLEDLRAVAQNFTAQAKSVYVATLKNPPSVLVAASADSGVDAGKLVKAALTEAGGRGGGNARIAQGSVPDAALLDLLVAKIGGK
jgi:alanyl-tRNA synthetase